MAVNRRSKEFTEDIPGRKRALGRRDGDASLASRRNGFSKPAASVWPGWRLSPTGHPSGIPLWRYALAAGLVARVSPLSGAVNHEPRRRGQGLVDHAVPFGGRHQLVQVV